jgi:hypothetical protein
MEFPKQLVIGPEANNLYKKLVSLKNDLEIHPSCGTLYRIKLATKELCAATGIQYKEREFRI